VVILDAAPTLPVADAAVLAAHCHGVVLVARHGWVRSEQVKAAAETLRRVSAPIFGVVLSMAPRAKRGGGYSDRYGYSYGYTYSSSTGTRNIAGPPAAPGSTPDVATLPAQRPIVPGVPAPLLPVPRSTEMDFRDLPTVGSSAPGVTDLSGAPGRPSGADPTDRWTPPPRF
jgi:hypothetical protein